MAKLVGAIFPVPAELVAGLFNRNLKVFVKYIPHSSTQLTKGNKIIFYESGGSKSLIGEGRINRIEFFTPDEVIEKYKELLFINKDQLYTYVRLQPKRDLNKKMLTLTLIKLERYDPPIKYEKRITMAGRYVYSADYHDLLAQ